MDTKDVERARESLVGLLAEVDAGELHAPRRVVDQIRGAVAALDTLILAATERLR